MRINSVLAAFIMKELMEYVKPKRLDGHKYFVESRHGITLDVCVGDRKKALNRVKEHDGARAFYCDGKGRKVYLKGEEA